MRSAEASLRGEAWIKTALALELLKAALTGEPVRERSGRGIKNASSAGILKRHSRRSNVLIFQIPLRVCRNWHHGACTSRQPGCRGFAGPVPPPLSMRKLPSSDIHLLAGIISQVERNVKPAHRCLLPRARSPASPPPSTGDPAHPASPSPGGPRVSPPCTGYPATSRSPAARAVRGHP